MLALTNMWLVDKQHACLRILGTNFKRYRLCPSGIPALADLLIFKRGVRMMWSQDDVHWAITCLIGMDCACLHVKNFSSPSPWCLCSSFPLPPYKNLCLHWDVKWMLRQESPIFPGRRALRHEAPIFQVVGIWINLFPLHQHLPPTYWLLKLQVAGPVFGYISMSHILHGT